MDRRSFYHFLHMIQDDPVLYNDSDNSQDHVASQLHYALYKLGHDGGAVGYIEAASKWGISEGHIYNTTSCVIETLCNLKDKMIIWPSTRQRKYESMINNDREGFLGTVGKIDGTDIILKHKPGGIYDGETFSQEKKCMLWIYVRFAIWINDSLIFLLVCRTLNMMLASLLPPIFIDRRKITFHLANIC